MNKLKKILELYKKEVGNKRPLHLDHKWIVSSSELSEEEKEQLELLMKDHNSLIKNLNYADLILSFILDKFILQKEDIEKIKRPPSLSPYSLTQESLDELQYYIRILKEYISTARWMAETSPNTLKSILPLYLTAVLPDIRNLDAPEDVLVFTGLSFLQEVIQLFDETLYKCDDITYRELWKIPDETESEGILNDILEIQEFILAFSSDKLSVDVSSLNIFTISLISLHLSFSFRIVP